MWKTERVFKDVETRGSLTKRLVEAIKPVLAFAVSWVQFVFLKSRLEWTNYNWIQNKILEARQNWPLPFKDLEAMLKPLGLPRPLHLILSEPVTLLWWLALLFCFQAFSLKTYCNGTLHQNFSLVSFVEPVWPIHKWKGWTVGCFVRLLLSASQLVHWLKFNTPILPEWMVCSVYSSLQNVCCAG